MHNIYDHQHHVLRPLGSSAGMQHLGKRPSNLLYVHLSAYCSPCHAPLALYFRSPRAHNTQYTAYNTPLHTHCLPKPVRKYILCSRLKLTSNVLIPDKSHLNCFWPTTIIIWCVVAALPWHRIQHCYRPAGRVQQVRQHFERCGFGGTVVP